MHCFCLIHKCYVYLWFKALLYFSNRVSQICAVVVVDFIYFFYLLRLFRHIYLYVYFCWLCIWTANCRSQLFTTRSHIHTNIYLFLSFFPFFYYLILVFLLLHSQYQNMLYIRCMCCIYIYIIR